MRKFYLYIQLLHCPSGSWSYPSLPHPEVTIHGAKMSLVLCRYLGQGRLSQHSVAIQRHLEAHPHGGEGGRVSSPGIC